MGDMSVRNLPEETHEALKTMARENGRSAEAEVRAILVEAATRSLEGGFGSRLRNCFDTVEGDELSFERDKTPAMPLDMK